MTIPELEKAVSDAWFTGEKWCMLCNAKVEKCTCFKPHITHSPVVTNLDAHLELERRVMDAGYYVGSHWQDENTWDHGIEMWSNSPDHVKTIVEGAKTYTEAYARAALAVKQEGMGL